MLVIHYSLVYILVFAVFLLYLFPKNMLRHSQYRRFSFSQRFTQPGFDSKTTGQKPLSFLETLFTSDTATAQAALYNDSS